MMKKALSILIAVLMTLSLVTIAFAAPIYRGDLDRNGKILAKEARSILRMSARLDPVPAKDSEEFKLADVDGDGKILAKDARSALRMSASLDPKVPLYEEQEEPASIAVCLAGDPDNLDPAFYATTDGATMIAHLFSGLARWSVNENGVATVVPDAAEALVEGEQGSDGKVTYTYKLRAGLKWSDGKPVKAEDFVFAWNRAASPALMTDYGYMFNVIDGYDEVWNVDEDGRQIDPDARLNVKALDDRTLQVTLTNRVANWDELLAYPTYAPVREDVAANGDWAKDAATFVCNGLYTMTGWTHGESITLGKNAAHPNADAVTMDKIVFRLSEDAEADLAAFKRGELMLIDDVPVDALAALETEYADELKIVGELGTYFVMWNVNAEILPADNGLTAAEAEKARAEIRTAISLLIDRNHIVDEIARGGQKPASTFVPMGITDANGGEFYKNAGYGDDFDGYFNAYDAGSNRDFAIATLKKYYAFDEASGKFTNFPTFSYVFNAGGAHQAIGEYIQSVLADVGIPMELEAVSWADFLNIRQEGGFTLARNGWIADLDDPESFLDLLMSVSNSNDSGLGQGRHADVRAYSLDLTPYGIDYKVENATWAETYDQLIYAIRQTRDDAQRYTLMHLAEDMVMATGVVCPLYYYTDVFMLNANVKGFFSNPLGVKFFMYTTVK